MALGNVWRLYSSHLRALNIPFQPVLEDLRILENLRGRRYRYHYLVPFGIAASAALHTTIMSQIHENHVTSPVYFHHLLMSFMPTFFIQRSDLVLYSMHVSLLFLSTVLFFENNEHSNFIFLHSGYKLLLPYQNRPEVELNLGQSLYKFHKAFRQSIDKICDLMRIELFVAFLLPLIVSEAFKMFQTNLKYCPNIHVFFCLIISPLYFDTAANFLLRIGFRFIGQNCMIQIKQKYYLSELFIKPNNIRSLRNVQCFYPKYHRTMEKVFSLTNEIESFNRFYKRPITALILCYGFCSASFLDAIMVASGSAPILALSAWLLFGLFYALIIWLCNAASSRTIGLNVILFKRLRRLQIILLSSGQLSRAQIVRLELVNEYKALLYKCSFRLWNSASINNKLFVFQIFSYVSVFYMKLSLEYSSF